jgi:hypothetical protein
MTDTAIATAPKTTAFTVSSDDAAQALRMGWVLAELRGRLDPLCAHISPTLVERPTLGLDAADERNPVERQVEATKVLSTLGSLSLTRIDIATLSGSEVWNPDRPPYPARKTPDMLRYLVCRLIYTTSMEERPHDPVDVHATLSTSEVTETEKAIGKDKWWTRVEWFLWAWDEALQDQLAAGKFGTASAYELGRGLSESYWALRKPDAGQANDAAPLEPALLKEQWGFLLGDRRTSALSDLARRLAPVFSDYTSPAVVASVTKWNEVAKNPGAYVDPELKLGEQIRVWRDLLVTGRDPLSLVEPTRLEAVARDPRPIIKAFIWELLAALVLAAGLALALTYEGNQVRSVLAALAVVGISASAIVSWIKARAQSVASRVGSAVDQSVVNEAVTKAPDEKNKRTWRTRIFLPLDSPAGRQDRRPG